MILPAPFIASLERWLNRVIRLDPEAVRAFGELSGKVIAIELIKPEAVLFILPYCDGIRLHTAFDGDVHVRIVGRPLALLSMARRHGGNEPKPSGDVEISGDVRLAQRFQRIMDNMDIDWEELLSHWVGDVAAHQIGNFARSLRNWVSETQHSLEMDVAEYLLEESQLVARREDVDEFVGAVDTLRGDLDRLEDRLKRIERGASRTRQ
ncbi:MAG: SCP2 sterol-binding domain-containing protein [Gammaproteobacteria bacterium]|nr:SCP2 sterol-binding domain-containing protein [Gammaproteobacteria bacterium]